jgi:hypothetical protein
MTAVAAPKSPISSLDALAGELLDSYLSDERARRISHRSISCIPAISGAAI